MGWKNWPNRKLQGVFERTWNQLVLTEFWINLNFSGFLIGWRTHRRESERISPWKLVGAISYTSSHPNYYLPRLPTYRCVKRTNFISIDEVGIYHCFFLVLLYTAMLDHLLSLKRDSRRTRVGLLITFTLDDFWVFTVKINEKLRKMVSVCSLSISRLYVHAFWKAIFSICCEIRHDNVGDFRQPAMYPCPPFCINTEVDLVFS